MIRPQVAALLCLHIAVWTLAACIGASSANLHHDMTEAYDWGREFQLGYAKHPPVFAWVAGAWFLVFPRADWAFYLLSATSAAGGVAGVWCLAGRLLPQPQHTAALLLVILAPFFSVLAITFNGNAILLLTWPWTVYAFVRSLQTGKATDGVLFGLIAAVALCSKYSSILLLASCFIAAVLHPRARSYFSGPAPYAAIAACLAGVAPHVLWSFQHGLTTVAYVLDKEHLPLPRALTVAGTSILAALAQNALPVAALWAMTGTAFASFIMGLAGELLTPRNRWLTVLAAGPFVLTVLAALAGSLTVSTNFLLPTFFIMPIALLAISGLSMTQERLAVLWRFVAGWLLAGLALAPVAAVAAFLTHADAAVEPRREIAIEATRLWHEAFGTPVRIAAGTDAYGLAAPFYSPDAPHLLIYDMPGGSPWISPEDIARDGVLMICVAGDPLCLAKAAALATTVGQHRTVRLQRRFLGWQSTEVTFELVMIPPR